MRLTGLVSHRTRRTFMNNGNGVSHGDRNRNAPAHEGARGFPVSNSIVGIDWATASRWWS